MKIKTLVMWALCLFLAAEWNWFGMMHFTLHDETIAQMPPFIPFKSALATLTGCASKFNDITIDTERLAEYESELSSRSTYAWAAAAAVVNDPEGRWTPPEPVKLPANVTESPTSIVCDPEGESIVLCGGSLAASTVICTVAGVGSDSPWPSVTV